MPSAGYNAQLQAAGRVPFWLVELALPRCGETYGVSPCTASGGADGTYCSYVFGGENPCADQDNYDISNSGATVQTLRFTSADAPIPPLLYRTWPQIWPLVGKVSQVAQELRIEDGLSLPDKLKVQLLPIRAMGSGTCPPLDADKSVRNTSRAGDYFRRLLAQYPNYHRGTLTLKRGFYTTGWLTTDFESVWKGSLENVQIGRDGSLLLEAQDVFVSRLLTVPRQISSWNVITENRDRDDTSIAVTDATEFTDPADITGTVHAEVESFDGGTEIVIITSIASNTLTVTRGALNTIATPIRNKAAIREIYNAGTALDDQGAHPTDVAVDLLNRAGTPAGDIDTTQIAVTNSWIGPAVVKRRVVEPTDVRELVHSVLSPFQAVAYVNEDRKVRIHIHRPPDNDEDNPATVIDADNVLVGGVKLNTGERHRLTHARIKYADKDDDGQDRHAVAVNNTTFSANYYGDGADDRREKKIETDWIQPWDELAAGDIVVRAALMAQHPRLIFTYEAELRDDAYQIGDLVNLTTADVQTAIGGTRDLRCAIIGKSLIGLMGFRITLQETGLGIVAIADGLGGVGKRRYGKVGAKSPGGDEDYDSASISLKLTNAWIGDASNLVGTDDDDGYYCF